MDRGRNSPDPPNDLVENKAGSSDKYSQESVTLRHALRPLPDTQPDTQLDEKLEFETDHQPGTAGKSHHSLEYNDFTAAQPEFWPRQHATFSPGQKHNSPDRDGATSVNPVHLISGGNEHATVIAGQEHHSPGVDGTLSPAMLLSQPKEDAAVVPGQLHHSPGLHGPSSVQLLSRPKDHTTGISDLDVGFSYAAPVKIYPGQYRRPKPDNMRTSIVDNGVHNVPANVPTTMDMNVQAFEDVRPVQAPPVAPTAKSMSTPAPRKKFPVQAAHIAVSTPKPQQKSSTAISQQCHSVPSTAQAIAQEQKHLHDVTYNQHQVIDKTPEQSHAALVLRKQPLFPDYRPVHQDSGNKDRLPTPTSGPKMCSPGQAVPPRYAGPHIGANQGQSKEKDHQRQLPSEGTDPDPQQKKRTSFQNDVSVVTSAQPPRTLSQLSQRASPRVGMMNRPVRDEQRKPSNFNTPRTRPRASSGIGSKSNVKRKRLAAPVSASSSRSSNYGTPLGKETPSMRQRRYTADQLRDHCLRETLDKKNDLVRCLNKKFDMESEAQNQLLQVIAQQEQKLKRHQDRASEYKKQTQCQGNRIHQLEEGHDQVLSQLQATKQELEERSAKFSKLENKCRTYKEYLNTAIVEQQTLYKASRDKCNGAIAQMQAEESKRQCLLERERKQAEAVRERLSQRVKTAIDEAKQKEEQFENSIASLNQKVQEREAEVLRERETAQALLRQQDSITAVQDTLKIFGIQIEEAVSKVNEATSLQSQQDDTKTEKLHFKLDQIIENLQSLDERSFSKNDVSEELQELNEKAVASILGRLEPILESQLETKENLNSLCMGLGEYVDELWQALEMREDVLEEYIVQKQEEDAQQMASLQEQLQASERDCAQERHLFFNSQVQVRDCQQDITKLRAEIIELEHARADTNIQADRLKQLEGEHAKLKDEAAGKAAQVSELEARLQESKFALEAEVEKHRKDTEELRKLVELRVAEAQAAQVKAVEDAQRDTMLQMNEIKESIETRLQQALEARATLQRELDAAKQHATVIGDEGSKSSEKIHSLEKELETSKADAAKLREVGQRDTAQQSKHVAELQSQLAIAEKRYNTLSGNAKAYDKAARTVLQSMRQWTTDYTAIKEMAKQIDRTRDGDISKVDPTFKPLVQLQILQKAVIQYCQAQEEAVEELSGRDVLANTAFNAHGLREIEPALESRKISRGSLLDQVHRVVVRSPANFTSPQPPSVQAEQEHRRAAGLPRSILKPAVYAQQQVDQDEPSHDGLTRKTSARSGSRIMQQELSSLATKGGILNRSSLNRGPYNRLVASSNAAISSPVEEEKTVSGDGDSGQVSRMGQGRKRKELWAQESEVSRHTPAKKPRTTIKRERASLSTPRASAEPQPDNVSDHERVPRAPRKTDRFLGANNEQPNSPIRAPQSHDSDLPKTGTAGTSPGPRFWFSEGTMSSNRRAPSLPNGRDPLALFIQRRQSGCVNPSQR